MNEDYKLFLIECIKNRKFLEFTYKDMSNCLIEVSEDDYIKFEKGRYKMSKENLIRIVRVLCINKPSTKNIDKYINISELSKEEISDLSNVISSIVGDVND